MEDEPTTTTINIGGQAIILTKTITGVGSSTNYTVPYSDTDPVMWGRLQFQRSYSSSIYPSCTGSYEEYISHCPSGGYTQNMYCTSGYAGSGSQGWFDIWGLLSGPSVAEGTVCGYNRGHDGSTQWRNGITDSARVMALAPGLKDSSFTINAAAAKEAYIVRELPVCPGSTHAIPTPVQRIDGSSNGSQWREFVSAAPGMHSTTATYTENIKWAELSINQNVTCAVRKVGTSGTTNANWLASGVAAINGCPNVTAPGISRRPGVQLFEYVPAPETRPRFRYCCSE